MKNTKFTKITLLVLTLALVFGSIVPMTVSAETTEATKPEIISQNVSYSTNLAVKLAVKADTATAPIKLYRYDSEPAVGEVGELVATSSEFLAADSAVNNLPADSYVIQAPGVAASAIAHYYYYQIEDANGNKSDVFRYSVAEYLYERLATEGISDTQKTLYNATIAYGDAAQVHFKSTDPRVSTLNLVTVDGGVVDGYAQGLYATGATVTPSGAGVSKWTVKAYDAEGNVTTSVVTSNTAITVAGRTVIEAGEVKSYRAGTHDFENQTLDAAPSLSNTGFSTSVVVSDKVYGRTSKVVKTTLESGTFWMCKSRISGVTDANAFELSFDVKIPTADTIYKLSDGKYAIQIMNKGGELVFRINKSPWTYIYTGASATEYNHVRFVHKAVEGEAGYYNCYIYINGSDTPYCFDTLKNTTAPSTYTVGTVFTRIAAYTSGNTNYSLNPMYIDNYFCGLIKE